MPIRSLAAMNRSLNNDYGATAGPNAPASHQLALFSGDPLAGGVELVGFGYARVTIAQSAWAAAVDGTKTLAAAGGFVTFPAPTGAWPEPATHWALYGADGNWWDTAALTEPLDVTAASATGPTVQVTVFYDDAATTNP